MTHSTPPAPRTTRLQRAVRLHEVPPERWTTKVKKTTIGLIFFLTGMGGLAAGWPLYVSLPVAFFGVAVWDPELLAGTAMALLRPYRAYKRAERADEASDA